MLLKKMFLPFILVTFKVYFVFNSSHRHQESFISNIVLFYLGRNLEVFLNVCVYVSMCVF